jgi:diketogulonate reductase-like aldo/keto reductase
MAKSRKQKSKRRQTRRRKQKGGSQENNNLAEAIRRSLNNQKKNAGNGSNNKGSAVEKKENKSKPLDSMPQLCFGTVQSNLEHTLPKALEVGYRHIDGADAYESISPGHRKTIRSALANFMAKGHSREELWITWKSDSITNESIQQRIKQLGCTYIDLFLIHHFDNNTLSGNIHMLDELSKAKDAGLIHQFGVSNCEDSETVKKLKGSYDIYANQIQARPPGGQVHRRKLMIPDFVAQCNAIGVHCMFFASMSGVSEVYPEWYFDDTIKEMINKYYIQRFLKPSNVLLVTSINPDSGTLEQNLSDVQTFLEGKKLLTDKEMAEMEERLKSITLVHM